METSSSKAATNKMRILWIAILMSVSFIPRECYANLPPSFSLDMNNQVLSERTPVGEVVFTLEGTDPEGGPVYYGLHGTDLLKVDRDTGEVRVVKPLDHEVNDTLKFYVTLEDEVGAENGGMNNVVEEQITVIILDENDNEPLFQNVPYEITVPEDAAVGATVFSGIKVSDADSVGTNIEVQCENVIDYLEGCDTFSIDTNNSTANHYEGSLVLKHKLNYNQQRQYQFILRAMDGELNSTTLVNIAVGDVQDTPPKFTSQLSAQIDENAPINTLIMTIHAEDGDRGSPRKIVYELTNNPMNLFLLDAVTGELRTAKPLDKEALDNPDGVIVLNIKAREIVDGTKGDDPLTVTTAEVVITIKDVNDEPPTFNRRDYYVEIPEDIQEGSALPNLDIFVQDTDTGNNSIFSLSLDDILGAFSIEPKIVNGSAHVIIKVSNSSLDYENPNQRKFIILAVAREIYTEEHLSSTATVTVTVTDANDNAPQFDYENYSAIISEMSSPGTLVTSIVAKDRDSGRFGENGIVYQLSGSGAEKFVVNNRTGAITVAFCEHPGSADCLDYETKSEYFLQFKAIDDDGTGQTTSVPLKISLTDSNDNPPEFSQPVYRVFVNEDALRFDPDLIVTAKDIDKTSHVTYSIIAGNDDNLFNIEPNTGKIRMSSSKGFDVHKNKEGENFIVLTIEGDDGKHTATTLVNITILDVNNNAPEFPKKNYVEAIQEDVTIGTIVAEVGATDADTGLNAKIHYRIQKGAFDDFEVDENTGTVRVASKLDYDRRNTYNIEIVAEDEGEPVLSSTAILMITIINTNDKLPYFIPTTQKTEVMEDTKVGTVIHTLVALDPDVNTSEALNFAATEPITAVDKYGNEVVHTDAFKDFFLVDKNSGKVYVANQLQRDIAAVVRITVLVTDITAPSVQQGQGLLVISIADVNDSPPQFLPPWTPDDPSYSLELREEQPIGTIVATYKAIDKDSDIAAYTIYPESEYFQINNGTGIIQIKKQIDYEKLNELNFTIWAYDSGIPQLNASATVFVKVINVNDNDPLFSAREYNTSVSENSPNGTKIIVVTANDLDKGDYGKITYSLTGEHSENFKINPETGEITVANSNFLDHEVIKRTVLQVVASDGAPNNIKRSISVPVYLNITDINDNAPIFSQKEYNVTVMENIGLNPPVRLIQVNATDADEDAFGNIRYSIVAGNLNDTFIIGVETGIIYPHKSLMSQMREFHLTVEARDGEGHGHLFDRATVNIQVLNVNEHKPMFVMPALPNATVEVTENSAGENYLVMTVKAVDEDEGENGRVTYHLKLDDINVQETAEFAINPDNGELRTKVFLDREARARYDLILVARDHGSPKWYESTRRLIILLVDANDNRPEFPDSSTSNPYQFSIVENGERNVRIGQVKALDRDIGKHAKVFYYLIMGNEDHAFYLDRTDGSLYTNKSFDREETEEFNLYILANNEPDFFLTQEDREKMIENDFTHDSSIAKVKVTIIDLNDNAPKFQQSIYYAAVNAMANINDFVANVTATDPDNGVNGTLTYYVKASNLYKYGSNKSSGSIIPSPFNITQNGQLNTATYLAENNQHRFVVSVIARENAFPEREALAEVHVWIFEQEQLIRVILSRPVEEVYQEREEIIAELSNATQSLVIIYEIRYHTDINGYKNEDWSDMYILVVDPLTQTTLPVPEILKIIDAKYDFLKDYYAGFAIENVVPAFAVEKEESFDPALAALIALLIVLFVGIITFIVVCCCLRHWVISPSDLKKKDALIKKAIIDDLNTTENPLWIEQKLKIYEEQELTMQVFNEPEQTGLARRNSEEFLPDDNTYATIQHPNRRGSSHMATLSLAEDLNDYATLSGVPHHSGSSHSSLRGAPNYYEAAMGFQGSTFQVPEPLDGGSFENYPQSRFKGSELTINREGQPEFVAELI